MKKSPLSYILRWEGLLILLIVVVSLINSWLSPYFLQATNQFRNASSFMEMGLMMLPMSFIIITGNIDLSVASILGMTASFMGWLFNNGINIWVAAGATLILGGLAGLLNGLLIAKMRLPSLVVTLGTFAFYRGVAYVLLGDQAARGYPEGFTYIGQGTLGNTPVPFSLLVFIVFALIFGLLLHKTIFGRQLYAIGNNEEACRYSGIDVDRVKIIIFTMSGLMSALAGIMLASRFGSTRPDIGVGMELSVITATVLGGIDIFGGSGTMVGALLSLLLIGLMRFGMGLMNIQGQVQSIAIGSLLILAILLPHVGRQFSAGKLKLNASNLPNVVTALLIAGLFGWFFMWSRTPVLAVPEPTPTLVIPTPTPKPTIVLKPTPTTAAIPPTPTPRPTPTAAPIVETEAESNSDASPTIPKPILDMVEIPAGAFTLGSDDGEPNETPAQTVELALYYMDRFEVTNADFSMFVEATKYETTAELNGSNKDWRTEFEEGKSAHPVTRVSWDDAQAYCTWLDKRLPTEAEWEKAARGSESNLFPWGNNYEAANLNGKDSGIRNTVVVGSFPAGASPYGIEDMAGNVWEWTTDPYQAYPNSRYEDAFYSDDLRITRGGGWFDEESTVRVTNRSAADPTSANDDLGFRCVADTLPTPEEIEPIEPEEAQVEPTPAPKPIEDMVEIAAGTFIFGNDTGEDNETPAQEIDLPPYLMDRFEVINDDFAMFVEATGYETTAEQSGANKNWRTEFDEGKGAHPVTRVSWADAQTYCEWLDKRLPTETEWEKAARGETGNLFPWGNSFSTDTFNGKDRGIRDTVVVGSFPAGASPYGVEDMAGNVWEWTADPYQAYPGSDYQDPFYSNDLQVTRGGGWFDDEGTVRTTNRSAAAPDSANDDLGFRCVKDISE